MHHALLAIYADVRLQSEVLLVAFASLMHLRIAFFLRVLGRRRRMNYGRIDNGFGRNRNCFAG